MRALALRQLAQGITAPQVAAALPLTPKAIREIAHRYNSNGLEAALYDKPRPGAKPVLDDSQKQRIVAMVCSKPPEGRARWTVRLIVEEAVTLALDTAIRWKLIKPNPVDGVQLPKVMKREDQVLEASLLAWFTDGARARASMNS